MADIKLSIAHSTKQEISVAQHYYNQQCQGLGDSLVREVEQVLSGMAQFPSMYQRLEGKLKHYRRAILNRFPYVLIYRISGGMVYVDAFFPVRSNPKNLHKRLKN